MTNNLVKYFPKHNRNQLKDELNRFETIYNTVKKTVGNIIDNVDEYKDLISYFPGYSKKLVDTFIEQIEGGENNDTVEYIVDNLLEEKSNYKLIQSDYIQDDILNEFYITAKSIGVLNQSNKVSTDLKDKNNESNRYNYLSNYKNWIGKKLLMGENEINSISVEGLDVKIIKYINLSIDHINKVFDSIQSNQKEELKSIYFDLIHSKENQQSFFNLFKLYYDLEKTKRKELANNSIDDNSSFLDNIRKGQFEIQRLFALASSYLDREFNLTFQNAKEEQDFLISKLANLGTKERKEHYLNSELKSNNLFYNYSKEKPLYWKKNPQGNGYLFSEVIKKGYNKVKMDTFEIEGKYRDYEKNKHKIDILNVGTRIRKNPFSSVEKKLRKGLSSYAEILDHKGFIFVIDNYEKDLSSLIKILENEFGTLRTSWIEESVAMKDNGNSNSSGEYNSMKGILKFSYKGKQIKDFFDLLGEIVSNDNFRKINADYKIIKKSNSSEDLLLYGEIVEKIGNSKLQHLYNDLKLKFGDKKYSIEVEIQIFDKENYIKAEIDENSSAFHGRYKESQGKETLPMYFPRKIYGESIRNVMIDDLPQTEKYKYLK